MTKHILAIDQGTTSTRALIMNQQGEVLGQFQKAHEQYYPNKAWVEHDPEEIWHNTVLCCNNALLQAGLSARDIACMGITNQRETTLLWDKQTGKPVYSAIVWQDRRTAKFCEKLKQEGHESWVSEKSGLLLDPYFSASKIAWILEHVAEAKKLAAANQLAFGTMDSFLLWRFTDGKVHATDVTNASRTNLFNIHSKTWDADLCQLFNIPMEILPTVHPCSALFAMTEAQLLGHSIPITGIAGDQQAAAIGQGCFTAGSIKTTYGTGCFMLMNIGDTARLSKNRLLTTILYQDKNTTHYALEGSIFVAGAGIKFLRDQLGIIHSAQETELLAASLDDNGGVYFVPALSGLGAPYWQADARGLIYGLSLDSRREHIARAMLEAIGYQTRDLLNAMQRDANLPIHSMKVDGGMVANPWLMQWIADILGVAVHKRAFTEITAYGVGLLAAVGAGIFTDLQALVPLCQTSEVFYPIMQSDKREHLYQQWLAIVEKFFKD